MKERSYKCRRCGCRETLSKFHTTFKPCDFCGKVDWVRVGKPKLRRSLGPDQRNHRNPTYIANVAVSCYDDLARARGCLAAVLVRIEAKERERRRYYRSYSSKVGEVVIGALRVIAGWEAGMPQRSPSTGAFNGVYYICVERAIRRHHGKD